MIPLKRLLMMLAFVPALAILPIPPVSAQGPNQGRYGVDLLYLMSRNYGVNYFLDRDRFEELGWNIMHSGVIDTIPPCPFYYLRFHLPSVVPEIPLSEIDATDFDAVLMSTTSRFASPIPFDEFLNSEPLLSLLRQAVADDVGVYSVCHASRVLAAAGVIDGKEVVCHDKWRGEIEKAGGIFKDKESPPTIAGTIVTGARDQYHSYVNTQALTTVVENRWGKTGRKDFTSPCDIRTVEVPFDTGDAVWARAYGGVWADGARAVCETDDGYLLVGYTFSRGDGDADLLALRVDRAGNLLWSRTYGGLGVEYAFDCVSTDDGFVVTGYTTSFGAGSKDVFLLTIDEDGKQEWMKTFGGASCDVGRAVCVTSAGDILIGAYTNSEGAGEEDIYVVKTDRNGKEIWSHTYGGPVFDIANSIAELDDGSILVGASTGNFGPEGNSNACLLKLADDGTQLWLKGYGSSGQGGHGFDWCRSMTPLPDGGAVLVGYADTEDIMNVYVVRTDPEGNELWHKLFGATVFYDFATSVRVTNDGGIIIAGTTKQVGTVESLYDNDLLLARLDMDGNLTWQRTLGGSGSDWGSAVRLTSDGDLIMIGHTLTAGAGYSEALLVKVPGTSPPPEPEEISAEQAGDN